MTGLAGNGSKGLSYNFHFLNKKKYNYYTSACGPDITSFRMLPKPTQWITHYSLLEIRIYCWRLWHCHKTCLLMSCVCSMTSVVLKFFRFKENLQSLESEYPPEGSVWIWISVGQLDNWHTSSGQSNSGCWEARAIVIGLRYLFFPHPFYFFPYSLLSFAFFFFLCQIYFLLFACAIVCENTPPGLSHFLLPYWMVLVFFARRNSLSLTKLCLLSQAHLTANNRDHQWLVLFLLILNTVRKIWKTGITESLWLVEEATRTVISSDIIDGNLAHSLCQLQCWN